MLAREAGDAGSNPAGTTNMINCFIAFHCIFYLGVIAYAHLSCLIGNRDREAKKMFMDLLKASNYCIVCMTLGHLMHTKDYSPGWPRTECKRCRAGKDNAFPNAFEIVLFFPAIFVVSLMVIAEDIGL